MRQLLLALALSCPVALAGTPTPWTAVFQYPNPDPPRPSPVTPSPKPKATPDDPWTAMLWKNQKSQPRRETRRDEPRHEPARESKPQVVAPRRTGTTTFVSGGVGPRPENDDFKKWKESDPENVRKARIEQERDAIDTLKGVLDGTAPRPKPRQEEEEE